MAGADVVPILSILTRMTHVPDDEYAPPRLTPAVQWLIAINVAIYLLQLTVVQPADIQHALGFEMRDLGRAWWTVGTYMFAHTGFWQLALNMYALFLVGPRVEHEWSTAEFTRYFLLCGVGAWVTHVTFVHGGVLIGASGAVYGVALAYAVRWPNDELYVFGVLPVKAKWLLASLVVIDIAWGLLPAPGGDTSVARLAHMGGIAAGWLYLRATRALSAERLKPQVAAAPDVPDEPPRAVPRSLPRVREKLQEIDEIIARSKTAVAKRVSNVPVPKAPSTPAVSAELDVVLDKISRDGLESLTAGERKVLEEVSRRLRKE
jgi:membrane associated rhomboid family serine protease